LALPGVQLIVAAVGAVGLAYLQRGGASPGVQLAASRASLCYGAGPFARAPPSFASTEPAASTELCWGSGTAPPCLRSWGGGASSSAPLAPLTRRCRHWSLVVLAEVTA
jgi:hypothetical protein